MKLTWYGTASIVLQTKKTVLAFDPYLKDLPKGRETQEVFDRRKNAFLEQKTVLITHGHFDHISSVNPLYKDLPCKVYLTKTPYNSLKSEGFPQDKMQLIKPGDTLCFDDVKIHVKQGKHIEFLKKDVAKSLLKKGSLRYFPRAIRLGVAILKYPENKETLVYEIEAEGKLIQIMGSASMDEKEQYAVGADVMILPHQGRSDIDAINKRIVDTLKPKRVLLDHYDDAFPPFSKNVPVDDFCEYVSKEIPTQKLIEGETIKI